MGVGEGVNVRAAMLGSGVLVWVGGRDVGVEVGTTVSETVTVGSGVLVGGDSVGES
jgi:hypothetical protein